MDNEINSLGGCRGVIVLFVVVLAAITTIMGVIAMLLWNHVIVALFNAQPISFLMACGICFVLSIIGSILRGGK